MQEQKENDLQQMIEEEKLKPVETRKHPDMDFVGLPDLPFGGDHSNAIKASGVLGRKENRICLPVSSYLIEHPKGNRDSDIDAVLITHLDCDHANGLKQVKSAKKFMVFAKQIKFIEIR